MHHRMLEQGVTEIQMSERQFWTFAQLQPVCRKAIGLRLWDGHYAPEMPENAQKRVGIFDKIGLGAI